MARKQLGKGDFRLGIDVDPSPTLLAKRLGKMSKEFNDYRTAWRRLAPALSRGIEDNIQGKGRPISGAWAKTNQRYQRRKAREGKGRIDLVVTRNLINSMGPNNGIIRLTKSRLVFGTEQQYARAVNFGFDKIRPRNFMGWNRGMRNAAIRELDRHATVMIGKLSRSI